jgi:hypothetical protein
MKEQIRNDVEMLAIAGGRAVGTKGHDTARQYLDQRLRQLQLQPYTGDSFQMPYGVDRVSFVNLVGRLPGQSTDTNPLLIGAHYDTCGPTPGADDIAAAVAIVLAAAKRLKESPLERDVIVAIFDAEEPPHFLQESMGSTAFYRHQKRNAEAIDCAFILDLVGHDVPIPGMERLLFITGMESHQQLEKVLLQTEVDERIKLVAALNAYVGDMSDYHIFRVNGIPYLFFSCGRWQHYHMPTDTPDKLNYDKVEAIANSLLDIVRRCDAAQFSPADRTYDSTPTELLFMNHSLGPFLEARGMAPPQSRADLDKIASLLLAQFRL